MFMHKTLVELRGQVRHLRVQLRDSEHYKEVDRQAHQREMEWLRKKHFLDIDMAKNEIRKEMEQALIESDLRRVKAEASLETFEEMDTKEERKTIQEMLSKAIDGLSQAKQVVVTKA